MIGRAAVTAAAVAVAVLTPVAVDAAPPGLGGVPCPDVDLAAAHRSVLVVGGDAADLTGLARTFGATSYAGVPALDLRAYAVRPGTGSAFIRAVRGLPSISWAGLDHVVVANRRPHDPLFRAQWALHTVHAPAAWDHEIGVSAPVTVAVLDTGVDGAHPDLTGRVLPGLDVVDGDTDATDEQFHGTAVASVVAANTDDHLGMAGLSWGAQILPVRVLDDTGAGTECTIAGGLVFASGRADVVNMSLGTTGPCLFLMGRAVAYAADSGAVIVASAGNSALKGNPRQAPADCPDVIGVGATDSNDRIAPFSEHGPLVDLSAPGVRVLAAMRRPRGRFGWALLDGTSLAAPMVSGVAALLLAEHPGWDSGRVTQRLERTAVDLGRPGRDSFFGHGRLDAGRALR